MFKLFHLIYLKSSVLVQNIQKVFQPTIQHQIAFISFQNNWL